MEETKLTLDELKDILKDSLSIIPMRLYNTAGQHRDIVIDVEFYKQIIDEEAVLRRKVFPVRPLEYVLNMKLYKEFSFSTGAYLIKDINALVNVGDFSYGEILKEKVFETIAEVHQHFENQYYDFKNGQSI